MYIKSFHIEGFGPLSNVHVEDIPCAMTVFLGNNEAGKSSAMEFVRAMLVGVPTKRNYLTQAIRNSKGGSMKIHDNYHGELDIIRHFSQSVGQVQILDTMNNALKKDILGDIFGGMSREVYRMIYGFNLLELQNINNFHGSEVFDTILGASFGLGLQGPVAALVKIQDRMDEIYKARGKNTSLQKLFDAWTHNKDEIDQATEEIKQYDLFKEKHSSLEEKLVTLRSEKTDIVRHGNEVQRFISMWGQWNKWAQLQTLITQLPAASVSFPENAELVLERILEQEKIKRKNLIDLEEKSKELFDRQTSFLLDKNLLQQEEIVQKLFDQKTTYKQALSDNMAISVKDEQFSHVLGNAHKRLLDKWFQLDPYSAKLSDCTYEEIAQHIEKIYLENPIQKKTELSDRQETQLTDHSNEEISGQGLSEFLQEFSIYEARILDAESNAQSARTAIDYAKRDLDTFNTKKAILEKEIQELMEIERKEQASNIQKLDAFSPISAKIDLTKEALRVIPEKLQRTLSTLDSWKRQIDTIGIRNLDVALDGEETTQKRLKDLRNKGQSFQLLSDGSDKDLYLHASDIIKTVIEFRPQITESAKKVTEQTGIIKNIEQQIERIDIQITDITDVIDRASSSSEDLQNISNSHTIEESDKQKEIKQEEKTASLKDNLDLKSRALQKLQTINELRSQGIRDFNSISQESKEAQKNLAEKKTSFFVLLPGIFCLLLGLPLLILRLLSGDNFIVFDAVQNIISFANLFPAWTGTLYVPFWLPSILVAIAFVSLYLPFSRKSDLELDQNRFNILQKKLASTLENLDSLRREEVSILSCAFNIKEVKQGKLFEAVRRSYEEEEELIALYKKENLSYKNMAEQVLTDENQFLQNHSPDKSIELSDTHTHLDIINNASQKPSHVQSLSKAGEKMNAFFTKVQNKVQGLLKEYDGPKKQTAQVPTQENLENLSLHENGGLSLDSLNMSPKKTKESIIDNKIQKDKQENTTISSLTPTDVEIIKEQKNYNPQYLFKILEENFIYREVAKFVHEELQMLWEKEYAFLIAEEQRNDIKAENHAKKLELLKNKKLLEENLNVSKNALELFLEEWRLFFEHHYFTLTPEAQLIEAFFFRIAAAESLQKRLQELNTEVYDYNEHIRVLRETVENEYVEILDELHNISQAQENTIHNKEKTNSSQNSLAHIKTQDMLLLLEKHIQNKRMALLSNKDISLRKAAFDDILQAQIQSREHLESVQQNLIERQFIVDEEFMECVNFLYQSSILSTEFVKGCQETSSASQLSHEFESMQKNSDAKEKDNAQQEIVEATALSHHMLDKKEKDSHADKQQSTSDQIRYIFQIASAPSKKLFLSNVKQTVEIMLRYLESISEYTNIKKEKKHTQEFIDTFESSLFSLMKNVDFTPIYSANVDYLEAFEQLYIRMNQERAKRKEIEKIKENIAHTQLDKETALEDLHEIRSNLDELLKLAQAEDENALRTLIESQKEKEQLVRTSLDLEEAFRTVSLPKYIQKSTNALERAFDLSAFSSLNSDKELNTYLPEIFAYFDDTAQNKWQQQLETITNEYERIESQEQDIQSTCGALQAKCDALIESATLASLKRVQVNIEEEIKETYEKWLELSLSKEIITKAQEQYEQERQPQVISMASEFFTSITDNAWKKIVLSLDNKEIKVMDSKGTLVNPDLLSQGAKEQLYLSLRLAHIKSRAITNQTVPILMDDILVNFDANRTENTIKTFKKLLSEMVSEAVQNKTKSHTSKNKTTEDNMPSIIEDRQAGQQILFYTCHEHTARLISDTIEDTKIYLVENKMVRPA